MAASDDANGKSKRVQTRGRHIRTLVVPLVLTVGMVATASALVSTGLGCGDGDGPRPDAGGDGEVDTPIV